MENHYLYTQKTDSTICRYNSGILYIASMEFRFHSLNCMSSWKREVRNHHSCLFKICNKWSRYSCQAWRMVIQCHGRPIHDNFLLKISINFRVAFFKIVILQFMISLAIYLIFIRFSFLYEMTKTSAYIKVHKKVHIK